MRQSQKLHHFKAVLTIHSISISVKFPCSVSVALKPPISEHRQQTVPSINADQEFKLINGTAQLQRYELRTPLTMKYNPKLQTYIEQKIRIVVYLKSSSGKIPAGSTTLLIKTQRDLDHCSAAIEKCPDKNAKIEFSLALEFINESKTESEESHILSKSSVTHSPVVNSSHTECKTPSIRDLRHRIDGSKNVMRNSGLYGSRILSSRGDVQNNDFPDDRSERSQAGSQSRISRILMKQLEIESSSQRQKIITLEKDKAKAMRQIRSLKHNLETNSLRNSSVSQQSEHLTQANCELRIHSLQSQIDRQKNKVSEYQTQLHKSRIQSQQQQKDLKILSKKHQYTIQEIKNLQKQNEELLHKNRNMNHQFNQLKQKFEDLNLSLQNATKRYEFKQNIYKQKLKQISEKYAISQAEKQRFILQKNQMITKYEQQSMKNKQNERKRELTHLQQKNKLIQAHRAIQKQLQQSNEQKQNLQFNLHENSSENHQLKLKCSSMEILLAQMNRDMQNSKQNIERQQTNRLVLESKINDLEQAHEEKIGLKYEINSKQLQLREKVGEISHLSARNKDLTAKISELEAKIREISTVRQMRGNRENGIRKTEPRESFGSLSFRGQRENEDQSHAFYQPITFQHLPSFNQLPSFQQQNENSYCKLHQEQIKSLRSQLLEKSNQLEISQLQCQEIEMKNYQLNQQIYTLQTQSSQTTNLLKTQLNQYKDLYKQLLNKQQNCLKCQTYLSEAQSKNIEIKTLEAKYINAISRLNNRQQCQQCLKNKQHYENSQTQLVNCKRKLQSMRQILQKSKNELRQQQSNNEHLSTIIELKNQQLTQSQHQLLITTNKLREQQQINNKSKIMHTKMQQNSQQLSKQLMQQLQQLKSDNKQLSAKINQQLQQIQQLHQQNSNKKVQAELGTGNYKQYDQLQMIPEIRQHGHVDDTGSQRHIKQKGHKILDKLNNIVDQCSKYISKSESIATNRNVLLEILAQKLSQNRQQSILSVNNFTTNSTRANNHQIVNTSNHSKNRLINIAVQRLKTNILHKLRPEHRHTIIEEFKKVQQQLETDYNSAQY